VLAIPRLTAAVAVRGSHWCLQAWYEAWDDAPLVGAIYGAADGVCMDIAGKWLAARPQGPSVEFFAAFWHARQERMVALAYLPDREFRPTVLRDGTHCFPWLPGYPKTECIPLMSVVHDQLAEGERLGIDPDAGPPFIESTVTAAGITTHLAVG